MALVEMVVLLLVMEVEVVMHDDVGGITVIVMKDSGDAESGGNDCYSYSADSGNKDTGGVVFYIFCW